MYLDCREHELTAASQDAVDSFDQTMGAYLAMRPDTGEHLKRTLSADDEMPMAQVLKCYFFMLMASAPLAKKARQTCQDLSSKIPSFTPREQQHIAAATHWSHGHKQAALSTWEGILDEYPRDILAMRLAHHGHFYKGDGQNLRDSILRRLSEWSGDVPGFGYVQGMAAFGFEESHDYVRAIKFGEAAAASNHPDPWAIHAVAHVHEMRADPRAGIAWIDEYATAWKSANNFRYHLVWHGMLMHLASGDHDQVLRLYDEELWDAMSDEYLDLVNDASLLLRLELHGVDVGERWVPLSAKCQERTSDQILTFIDVHFAIALAADGSDYLHALVSSLEEFSKVSDQDNAKVVADIGLPLVHGLIAHRQGNWSATVEALHPIRYRLYQMGGSHAQRDLFAMVLIDAAVKAKDDGLARRLISERLGRNDKDLWAQDLAAQIGMTA